MPQETVGEAIAEIARRCNFTNAPGMTPYSDDMAMSFFVSAFEDLMDEHEWDELVYWQERTLDGVNGLVTQLVTGCKDWKKIKRIYHESQQTPMALLSSYTNPLTSTLLFGYRSIGIDEITGPNGRYLVRFYPLTLTGRVLFQIERTLDFTDRDAIVPVDWWYCVYFACWQWATSDMGNVAQANMYASLMKRRMGQIMDKESSRPSQAQPNQMVPNEWFEQDAPYS